MATDRDFHLYRTIKGRRYPGLLSTSNLCMGTEFRKPFLPRRNQQFQPIFNRAARLTEVLLLSTNFIDHIADVDFMELTKDIVRDLEYRAYRSSKPKFQTLRGAYYDFVVEFTYRLSLLVPSDSEESLEDLNGALRQVFGERYTIPYKGKEKKEKKSSFFKIKKFFCRCFCCTCETV